MQPDKHPKSQLIVFYDTSCEKKYLISSTYRSNQDKQETIEFEGKQYPVCKVDTSSASHPVYTGGTRKATNEGKSARFREKYARNFAKKDAQKQSDDDKS